LIFSRRIPGHKISFRKRKIEEEKEREKKRKRERDEVGDAPSDKGDLTRSLKSLTRRTEMALA